jgi:hypothetical protein
LLATTASPRKAGTDHTRRRFTGTSQNVGTALCVGKCKALYREAVKSLTQAQVNKASGDKDTRLPSGLVHPWMDVPSAPEMDSTESDQAGVARTAARSCGGMTRIERDFDPEAVRQMKATAGRDITVAGPGPAAQAVEAGCVDECHLFVTPIVVGGGRGSSRPCPPGARTPDERHWQRRSSPPLPFQDVTKQPRCLSTARVPVWTPRSPQSQGQHGTRNHVA